MNGHVGRISWGLEEYKHAVWHDPDLGGRPGQTALDEDVALVAWERMPGRQTSSQRPLFSERKSASITRMLATASSTP